MIVRVRAFPRAHLALTDMGRATRRAYGGVGLAYMGEETRWRFQPSALSNLSGLERLDPLAQAHIALVANNAFRSLKTPVTCHLETFAPQHSGYGTKTSVTLSLLAGLRLYGRHEPDDHLASASLRGGASGIGIHAFFHGGFVWDGGHPTAEVEELLPSSARMAKRVPPLLGRWPIPGGWRVFDLRPDSAGLSGSIEKRFFLENAPVPEQEALKTVAAVCHGIIPAIACDDIELLSASLRTISTIGFKRCEIAAREPAIGSTLEALNSLSGVAAGMSSTGPMIACFVSDLDAATEQSIATISSAYGLAVRGPYQPCNHGFRVEVAQ